jgi:hypothetical protein
LITIKPKGIKCHKSFFENFCSLYNTALTYKKVKGGTIKLIGAAVLYIWGT